MKTLFLWFKQSNLKFTDFLSLLMFAFVESICNLLLPLSFANIITSATIQSYTKANLWIIIYFLNSILTILIKNYTDSRLASLKKYIIWNNTSNTHNNKLASTFPNVIVLFYNYLKFVTKTTLIIIFAIYFDYILATALLCSILICYNSNRLKIAKLEQLSNYIWPLLLTILLLLLNSNLSSNQLTISSFLIISTFINNHLLKTDFFPNYFSEINYIKKLLLNNNCKTTFMHKNQNSTNTKKN